MAMDALDEGYNILIEKPIDFERQRIHQIGIRAEENNLDAWAVLQVRYNPTVAMVREALDKNLLGTIRIVGFVQRWQRPYSYFEGWRGETGVGGGSLYEVGIHYLDIVQSLFGVPTIKATSTYSHKHKHVTIEDTVLSIAEYPNEASGTIEVTIASEPSNLECTLSILGSEGFMEIGGKALDEVTAADFEKESSQKKWDTIAKKSGPSISPNSYGTHVGSCPNHPTLYKEIAEGNGIPVFEAAPSIDFIQRIYSAGGIAYKNGHSDK
jgi:UDP-N-acetyl-2-amino-2-deoxyglucuronate dehydrogenase